jgi:hypothetical protein
LVVRILLLILCVAHLAPTLPSGRAGPALAVSTG